MAVFIKDNEEQYDISTPMLISLLIANFHHIKHSCNNFKYAKTAAKPAPRFNVVEQPNEWAKSIRLNEGLSEAT